MKKRCIRSLALILAVLISAFSLCSCFDIDRLMIDLGFYEEKKKVNEKFKVQLRETSVVRCTDETAVKEVYSGESVYFHIIIDSAYIYLGNSAGAEYDIGKDKVTGSIRIDSVQAPTTIDVYVGYKRELYYIEIEKPDRVEIEFVKGSYWSETQEEVSILLKYVPDDYVIDNWTKDGYVLGESAMLTFTPEKGINKIKINFKAAEE